MSQKNRFYSYLNSAEEILSGYDGSEPFSIAIRRFFRVHKKYGSRDRRTISHLCYCYFRLGKWNMDLPIQERILTALFLCSENENAIIDAIKPEWSDKITQSIQEKMTFLNVDAKQVFPWQDKLDKKVDFEPFTISHFIQPRLFLRIRPKNQDLVLKILQKHEVDYETHSDNGISVANGTQIDRFFTPDNEIVVQDYSSQRVIELFNEADLPENAEVWDSCAGSGGKSLLIYDENPDIKLTVSDVRPNILNNLKSRFKTAGIENYKSMVLDLSAVESTSINKKFDMILVDAPCTGSGTWSRTPEQLFHFRAEKINEYSKIQQNILDAVIPNIKPGGYLLYITCSIFEAENDAQIQRTVLKHGLQLINSKLLPGYSEKADTLFGALLKKPE